MSELNDLITSYKNLPFSDRVVFYTTVSNDISVDGGDLQPFLIETRMTDGKACIYCDGDHVVKNGTRRDGTQRYLCRDCGKSFIPSSHSPYPLPLPGGIRSWTHCGSWPAGPALTGP